MLKNTLFPTLILENGHPTVPEFKFVIPAHLEKFNTVCESQSRMIGPAWNSSLSLLWLIVAKMTVSHSTIVALNPGVREANLRNKRSLWIGKIPSNVSISSNNVLEAAYPLGWPTLATFQKLVLMPNYFQCNILLKMCPWQCHTWWSHFSPQSSNCWKSFAILHDLYWRKAN